MSRWWRAEDTSIDHPKLLRLSDAMHRAWYTLMCVASANDGVLPPAADIALRLRVKPTKVAEWIAKLVSGGLFDRNEDGTFAPHNWNIRQYKSDITDPTAAERMRRYRKNKRNERNASVTELRPETETEQNRKIAVADEDEPPFKPPARSLISPEATALADKLLVIAGHDLAFVPPGWCGAPLRVQAWLGQGWAPEIITAAVTAAAKRKSGAPAASVNFFEKAVAEEVARQAQPVPTVVIKERETINVQANRSAGTRSEFSVAAAARRLATSGLSFGPKPTGLPSAPASGNGDAESAPPVRLLSQG